MRHRFHLVFFFTLPSHRCLAVVDIECSVAAPCPGMNFENFNIAVENGTAPTYTCINVVSETGLPGKLCSSHATLVRITVCGEELTLNLCYYAGCKVVGSA